MNNIIDFEIEGEFIKLDQLLKASSIVQTGGEAKFLISEGLILINNDIEYQRGKKVRKGDSISFLLEDLNDTIIMVK